MDYNELDITTKKFLTELIDNCYFEVCMKSINVIKVNKFDSYTVSELITANNNIYHSLSYINQVLLQFYNSNYSNLPKDKFDKLRALVIRYNDLYIIYEEFSREFQFELKRRRLDLHRL